MGYHGDEECVVAADVAECTSYVSVAVVQLLAVDLVVDEHEDVDHGVYDLAEPTPSHVPIHVLRRSRCTPTQNQANTY